MIMLSELLLPISENTEHINRKQIKVLFFDDTSPSPLLIPHIPANIGYKWLRDNIRFLRLQQHGDNSLKFLKNRVFINESQFRKQ